MKVSPFLFYKNMIEITNITREGNTLLVVLTRTYSGSTTATVKVFNKYPEDEDAKQVALTKTVDITGPGTEVVTMYLNDANESLIYFVEASIPLGQSGYSKVSFIINFIPIYRESLKYIKEMNNNCSIPKGFIDYILRVKALDAISKTEDAQEVGKCWNKLFYERKLSNIKIPDSICYGHNN